MKKYKTVDVKETSLEDLICKAPANIEAGMRYVYHQQSTTQGRLDVLLVDSGSALVVAELKVVENDGMLMQALDYYDYVNARLDAFARLYTHVKIDPMQAPRLLLIAPSFSTLLMNRLKWLTVKVSVYRFKCIQLEGSEDLIPVFMEDSIPSLPELPSVTTVDQHLNYITDLTARAKTEELLDFLLTFGPAISIEPKQTAISIKKNNRVFRYLYARSTSGVVGYWPDGQQWSGMEIRADTDLDEIKSSLKAAFNQTGG